MGHSSVNLTESGVSKLRPAGQIWLLVKFHPPAIEYISKNIQIEQQIWNTKWLVRIFLNVLLLFVKKFGQGWPLQILPYKIWRNFQKS